MATINSKEMVDELIANNGEYRGDPPVYYIVQYNTLVGGTAYGICYDGQDLLNYLDSPYCKNQKMLFRRRER